MEPERKNTAAEFLTTFIVFGTGFIFGVAIERFTPRPSAHTTENVPHVMEQTKNKEAGK